MTGAPAEEAADPAAFRLWMSRWATGVTVVTARDGGRDFGLTVNAFLSIVLRPPTVLVSLGREADTTDPLLASGAFAVNLLAFDQKPLADRFARIDPPEEKFRGVPITRGWRDLPLLTGAIGHLACSVSDGGEDVGDHRLIVGRVERLALSRDVPPLLFVRRGYADSDGDRRMDLPPTDVSATGPMKP